MKKVTILAICAVFFLAGMISSCSKKLDQPGFPGFRCAFGLSEYIADTAYYNRGPGYIGTNIYATKGNTSFKFNLVKVDTTGSYSLDSILNTVIYFDGTKSFYAVSGTLAISQFYNDSLGIVNGSFNFDSHGPNGETLNFTYGYFNNIPRHK